MPTPGIKPWQAVLKTSVPTTTPEKADQPICVVFWHSLNPHTVAQLPEEDVETKGQCLAGRIWAS